MSSHDDNQIESPNTMESCSIIERFDQLCFDFGDQEALHVIQPTGSLRTDTMVYVELQEYSKALAYQLHWRFRPDFVLVDCQGWPGAELTAILACLRLKIPFVPVSCHQQHAAPGRLGRIVEQLVQSREGNAGNMYKKDSSNGNNNSSNDNLQTDAMSVVAVTCCANDQDPVLGVFQQANVHSILFVDSSGNLQETLPVPSYLPDDIDLKQNDNMYVLFTSGTSSHTPKAVLGSQRATLQRLQWFQSTFEPLPKVAKRTPLTFVDAMAELVGTLLTRDSLLVALEPTLSGVTDLSELISATQCQQISLLPSQLAQLLTLQARDPKCLKSLQRIIISGEPCRPDLWHLFCKVFQTAKDHSFSCQLINLYGQTETTGDCCGAVLTDLLPQIVVQHQAVTIGKPLRDSISIKLKLNNNNNNNNNKDEERSMSQDHELVVTGKDCCANGYLDGENRGFVFDQDTNTTSFHTGDLGFCQDGYWYIQGRTNDVVKLNGVWTAPSEIETAFVAYYQTCQAASAVMLEDRICVLAEAMKAPDYSRERMKQDTKLPWNLIPHYVFSCMMLPRTPGTGKVDRAEVKKIAQEKLNEMTSKEVQQSDSDAKAIGTDRNNDPVCRLKEIFQQIFVQVLMPTSGQELPKTSKMLDMSKSFVELGGDSASCTSLLYQLRVQFGPQFQLFFPMEEDPLQHLSPTQILQSESLDDLWETLMMADSDAVEKKTKKVKLVATASRPLFEAEPTKVWNSHHSSVEFAACVDVSPVVIGGRKESSFNVVAGCQNGVIQKVSCQGKEPTISPIACRHFDGWRLSSAIMGILKTTIYLGLVRHPKQDKQTSPGGKIMSLSCDLAALHWEYKLPPNCTIQSPLTLIGESIWVVVATSDTTVDAEEPVNEHKAFCLLRSCDLAATIAFPVRVVAKPALLKVCQMKRKDGSMAAEVLVYASCDWETGLLVVDMERKELLKPTDGQLCFFSETLGPVYKDLAMWDDQSLLVADSWGSLHLICFSPIVTNLTLKLSNHALSSPTVEPESSRVFVGGYDGNVHCVNGNLAETLWTQSVGAVVYTSPLLVSDGKSLVVCTTAGDAIQLDRNTGQILWRYRPSVGAEIWSDPIEIPMEMELRKDAEHDRPQSCTIVAFGGRDSRLHLVNIPMHF